MRQGDPESGPKVLYIDGRQDQEFQVNLTITSFHPSESGMVALGIIIKSIIP